MRTSYWKPPHTHTPTHHPACSQSPRHRGGGCLAHELLEERLLVEERGDEPREDRGGDEGAVDVRRGEDALLWD